MSADVLQYESTRLSSKEAEKIGTLLAQIEQLGPLTPETVLQHARDKASPLHRHFEWNNSKAAEEYRLQQAAWLLRTVKVRVVVKDTRSSARAFIAVKVDPDEPSPRLQYVSLSAALDNPDWRAQMIEQALRELESFRQKYAVLSELKTVIVAIEKVRDKHKKAAGK
jgi:hypothetical protein